MRDVSSRPIRPAGWAFRLPTLSRQTRTLTCALSCVLLILLLAAGLLLDPFPAGAQHQSDETLATPHEVDHAHEAPHAQGDGGWEGSSQGVAFSEFNHRISGLLLVLIGLFEGTAVLRVGSPLWTRLVLPGALGLLGVFVLVWSDHDAWPIGSLSFAQTFFGGDYEIVQHKLYGVLAVSVAVSEVFRRTHRVRHAAWAIPLPLFAVLGGLMLFLHSHGIHPAAEKIQLHHAIMGGLSVSAGAAKSAAVWGSGVTSRWAKGWNVAWAALILLIGLQLLVYSE